MTSKNSPWPLTIVIKIFFCFSLLYVLIIAGVILHPFSGDSSPLFVYPQSSYNNVTVMRCDINLNSNCLFTDYNDTAAMAIKSKVLSKLSLTNSIQILKPGMPLKFEKFREDNNSQPITPQKTCALVGNGGILLDSGCGREIDTHDFVVRCNLAQIKGYITDVGSKTSLMTINDAGLTDTVKSLLKKDRNQRSADDFAKLRFLNDSVLWYIKQIRNGKLLRKLNSISQNHNMKLRIAYSPQQMLPIAARIWNIKLPTSGLILYTFVAGLCDKISLYGFYPFSTRLSGDAVQHHYYEQKKFNYQKGTRHTFVDEYRILMQLHKQGAIRLVGDSCQNKTHEERTEEK